MAVAGFVKIDGIPGDSKQTDYTDQIELIYVPSWGMTQPTSGPSSAGALTVAQSQHDLFVITKQLDKATPKLLQYSCNGAHIPKVEVTLVRQAGETPIAYMKYELEDVVVARCEATGDTNGDGLPEEKIGLAYSKIKATYTDSDSTGQPGGQVVGEHDRRKGR